jgi:hypothetical protein
MEAPPRASAAFTGENLYRWETSLATYRVKAFFMHENEFAAAKRAEQANTITDTEWTDGYVIAVIDKRQVAGLVKQGLIVTPIERVQRVKAGGLRRFR